MQKRRWRRVQMSEIKEVHAYLQSRGEWYNGCTSVELVRRYGVGNLIHRAGYGWYKLTAN